MVSLINVPTTSERLKQYYSHCWSLSMRLQAMISEDHEFEIDTRQLIIDFQQVSNGFEQ